MEQFHIDFVDVLRCQFKGLHAYRSSHSASSNLARCQVSGTFGLLSPSTGQQTCSAAVWHENSAGFACLGQVFEILRLSCSAIQQRKLLLAATLSNISKLSRYGGLP